MTLKEEIAAARAEFEAIEPTLLDVEFRGKIRSLAFRPVESDVWLDLTATNPPRPGATLDGNVGYNTDAVAKVYPVDHVTVDGESVDDETWAEFVPALSAPNRKNIASVLWGINQMEPAKRLMDAGKASAGASQKKRR